MPNKQTTKSQPKRKGGKRKNNAAPKRKQRTAGKKLFKPIGQLIGGWAGGLLDSFLGLKSAPMGISSNFQTQQTAGATIPGCDLLQNIVIPKDTPTGSLFLTQLISPQTLGLRLKQMADAWANSIIDDLYVVVAPQNSSMSNGGYIVAFEPDPAEVYPSGPDLEQRMMSLQGSRRANIWTPTALHIPPNARLLYNKFEHAGASDAELRQFANGQLLIASTGVMDEDRTLSVYVVWKVRFLKPSTANVELPRSVNTIVYRKDNESLPATGFSIQDPPNPDLPFITNDVPLLIVSQSFDPAGNNPYYAVFEAPLREGYQEAWAYCTGSPAEVSTAGVPTPLPAAFRIFPYAIHFFTRTASDGRFHNAVVYYQVDNVDAVRKTPAPANWTIKNAAGGTLMFSTLTRRLPDPTGELPHFDPILSRLRPQLVQGHRDYITHGITSARTRRAQLERERLMDREIVKYTARLMLSGSKSLPGPLAEETLRSRPAYSQACLATPVGEEAVSDAESLDSLNDIYR